MVRKAAKAIPNLLLRQERVQRGWSREYVAERIEASDSKTVGRWERGTTSPGPYYRQKLCELFELTPTELGFLSDFSSKPAKPRQDQPPSLPDANTTLSVASPFPETASQHPTASLMPVWNVPYRRNIFFTGREDILQNVRTVLTAGTTVALTQAQAISGLGGVGKTQLAVEYAYRYQNDYRAILWVRADSREALISDYVNIAALLNLPEKQDQDQSRILKAFAHWLQESSDWLLILDNADNLTMINDFLPSRVKGHILLTTREQVIGTIAQRIEIEKMEVEEGALFLLRRAHMLAKDAPRDNVSYANWNKALTLSRALDGLPLALDQAGAYIEETECGLTGYQERLRTRRAKILGLRGASVTDHPEPVATTWSLSFEKVQRANPAAADLLRLCAFLYPDAIPEEIFTEGALELGTQLEKIGTDLIGLDAAIGELRRFSLLRRDPENQMLNIHRLVQAVIKDSMDEQRQRQWAERAVQALNHVFPEGKTVETWQGCQRCLPQVYACAALIEQWKLTFSTATRLLHEAGIYLRRRAQYGDAEALFQQVLAIREQTLEPMHPDVASILNDMACLYGDRGEYAQSVPLFQRALTIREQTLGADHPDVAQTVNNLAIRYEEQGMYPQAEILYQRALTIWQHVYGPKHAEVLTCLNNLANLYELQGKYAQAEVFFQQVLTLRRELLGASHPQVGQALNNLAACYHWQGKLSQAEPLFLQALAIWEHVFGLEHVEVATCLNNLGLLYIDLGKYALAELHLKQALTIRERILGPEHSHFASSLNNLAKVYFAQGRYRQAEQLQLRSLSIKERGLGSNHPYVANSLNSLGEIYRAQGNYVQASQCHQRALAIREEKLGAEHDYVAQSLNNLGRLYHDQGFYERAEALYQRSLTLRERLLGAEHPDVAASLNNIAQLYVDQGKYAEAEPLFQRALAIREQSLGVNHRDVAQTLNDLGKLYIAQSMYTQAEPLLQRALTIREQVLEPDHPEKYSMQ